MACNYTLRQCHALTTPDASNLTRTSQPTARVRSSYVARDAAGNVATVERTILIDNTAPAAPIGVRSSAEEPLGRVERLRLYWRNPNEPGRAPIAGANVAICPASNPSRVLGGLHLPL